MGNNIYNLDSNNLYVYFYNPKHTDWYNQILKHKIDSQDPSIWKPLVNRHTSHLLSKKPYSIDDRDLIGCEILADKMMCNHFNSSKRDDQHE